MLHVGVFCKWLLSQMFLKGSKQIEIAVRKIGTVRRCDFIASQPFRHDQSPSPVGVMGPNDFVAVVPSRST